MSIIGIDFGTTTSEVAIYRNEKATMIKNIREGDSNIIPSVVLIEGDNVKVGLSAKNQMVIKPKNTISEVKRLIGSKEPIDIDNKKYLPEEIVAIILKKLKDISEFYLGETVEEAIITVPANFNDFQRKATKEAGRLAGLKVERIINEPTAAAIAYGLDKLSEDMNILVYDFGGGTLDVTVLELFDGIINVKASRGDNSLGGKDIDNLVIDYVANKFNSTHDTKLDLKNPRVLSSLKSACENCKKRLSFDNEWDIIIPYITMNEKGPVDLNINMTRDNLESLVVNIIKNTGRIIDEAIIASGLSEKEIDKVVLVGGTTRMPIIKKMIAKRFGEHKIAEGVNPEEAVALGAAIQGAIKSGAISKSIIVTDAASYSLGVEVLGGKFDCIIKRDSKIPIKCSKLYKTVEDQQTDIEIRIFQGESDYVRDNIFIDSFELNNLPANVRGLEQVSITFKYDLNGILSVEAKSVTTGSSKELVVNVETPIDMHNESTDIQEKEEPTNINYKNEEYVSSEVKENLKVEEKEEIRPQIKEQKVEVREELRPQIEEQKVEVREEVRSQIEEQKVEVREELRPQIEEQKVEVIEVLRPQIEEQKVEVIDVLTPQIEDEPIEEEEDYSNIFAEIVNLVNYTNSILPSYDLDTQRKARDILRDMVVVVKNDRFKEVRQLEEDLAKLLNIES